MSRLAAIAAVAMAAAFLIAPPANAAFDTNTWYNIESRHSGLVLDIASGSNEPGAGLIQYTGNDGENQQFRFVDAGNGYYRIEARHSGHSLDVYNWNSDNGADIVQWTSNTNEVQQWQLNENSEGYYTFINRYSEKALDVWNNSTTPGDRVSQYTPTGDPNQQWSLIPVDGPNGSDPYGYLFAYMLGEGSANGEQVYYALSRGNDPLAYDSLNGGQPVAVSDVGEQGARDPFITQHPDTGRYYMIATDLDIYSNGSWDRAQRHGSLSLVVWESDDLINWSSARLVRVSPDEAGNTWAPEAYWDPTQNAFVVYWASKLYSTSDHSDNTYHRMMYATTTDFVNFSEAQVWVDKGYSTIDSTIAEHDGTYYRFTKDERSGTSCGKFILAETSSTLLNTDWAFQSECIGSDEISHGEGPLVYKSNTEEKWYMFIDEYGGRGYIPFETTDLSSGQWTPSSNYSLPGRPRHGMVLPLTADQYNAIQSAF
ncbi:RICIN domain-containing protein [Glycomyces sp. L485]|uniref:RICIN domain-containing protein n=1 Tax=Glycomyces sp. L485 TaxID=2909235 RepID=UPI001F4B5297|nr:RICIN domain-containing protein [Glycomyces sp. L485]MCH7230264.1 RICIN domain-containing protein [Glycomyces sp. L485]